MNRKSLGIIVLLAAACGDGDKDNVTVVTGVVDFGLTNCGEAAIPRIFTITNPSSRSMTYSTALSGGADSLYTITPASGVVLPLSQLQVTVYSRAIPAESAITDNLYGETITVTTDLEGDRTFELPITQTARGAVFEVSSPTTSFGALQDLGTSTTQPFTVTNSGNAAATLRVESQSFAFRLSQDGSTIGAGEALAGTIEFRPAHNQPDMQTLRLTVEGPTCALPATMTATGTGTAQGLARYAVPASFRPRQNESAGANTLCVILSTGVVACGGRNDLGMRGASDDFLAMLEPASGKGGGSVPGNGLPAFDIVNVVQTKDGYLTDVVELVSGTSFYCARRQGNDVWCWGDYRGYGNRGNNAALREHFHAVQVAAPGSTTAIAAGYLVRCSVSSTGTAACSSQRSSANNPNPIFNWTVPGASDVAVSGGVGYALLTDGTVMSFGRNDRGERGSGVASFSDPTPVAGLTGITQVVAGGRATRNGQRRFGCARKNDGTVWCWGTNRHGQLGNGDPNQVDQASPVQVIDTTDTALSNITTLTTGQSHACALGGGAVWCWGRGQNGQTGSGNLSSVVPRAEAVTGLTNATAIEAAGTWTTCAVLVSGAVRCWGQTSGLASSSPQPATAFEP